MRTEHLYFVYIVANKSRRLYIGVTNSLFRRIDQHRRGPFEGFTSRYKIDRLVYFERFGYIHNAIAREKQLKGWLRERKLALVTAANPTWIDLYDELLHDPLHSPALAFSRLGEPGRKQILRFAQDDNVVGVWDDNVVGVRDDNVVGVQDHHVVGVQDDNVVGESDTLSKK